MTDADTSTMAATVIKPSDSACATPQGGLGDLDTPTLSPATGTSVAPLRGRFRPLLEAAGRPGFALHYGNVQTPLVRVEPDAVWPRMWRMVWPDGLVSDMGNLSRIRDAAAVICERGPPIRNRRRFNWKAAEPDAVTERGGPDAA
jgi:hypothetical protein